MKYAPDTPLESLTAGATLPFGGRPDEPAEVRLLRERGWTVFRAEGFDVRGREEWKYTDLRPVAEAGYRPAAPAEGATSGLIVQPIFEEAWRLVFVDGVLRPELGETGGLPGALTVTSLGEHPDARALGTIADVAASPFSALNAAAWTDGVRLVVPDGMKLDRPLELHFLTDRAADGRLVAPRNLLVLGRGAEATVVECHVGSAGAGALNVPVTEIDLGANASLRHWKKMRESETARHFGSVHVRQAAGSRYQSREFTFGGALVRRELHVDLAGEGAHCDVTSLVMATGRERMDNRTRIQHRVPGCTTDELYKGIYAGQARGVFDGMIHVHRDAQQTEAFQTNRNLLLSDDAVVNSIPRLEIYADDVKCSHGSTTGQLDEEQVFFLRSRGFAADDARVMLAQAFGSEVVDGVDSPELRRILEMLIASRLKGVQELGGQA